MAITVDQLRSFDSNWGNLVVQQGGAGTAEQVKAGGLRHALSSLFHRDAAQARNHATYTAIRDAIMHDERFFAPEVKAKAEELLKGLDNGSGIKASVVKSIISQLDEMSTPEKQRETIRKAAIGHLAASDILDDIPGAVKEKYMDLAADFAAYRSDPKASMASINVGARVNEFNQLMKGIFKDFGDLNSRTMLCAALNNCATGDDSISLAPAERLRALADTVKENIQELREISQSRGAAIGKSCFAMLNRTGALRPDVMTAAVDKGATLPKCGLDLLNRRSDAGAIHRAVAKMADAMDKARAEMDPHVTRGLDDGELGACLVKSAMVRLPPTARSNLLDALESKGGMNLLGYYAQHAENPKAQEMKLVYSALLTHLRAEFKGTDPGATVNAPPVDVASLPPAAKCDFSIDDVITGAAASRLKALTIGKSGIANAAELQSRMNAIAKTGVAMTIITGIDSLRAGPAGEPKSGPPIFDAHPTGFDVDFVRSVRTKPDYVTIIMDDGTPVSPKTTEEARDAFVKFLTGDPNAKYGNVTDVKLKTKVHILMSCIHQSAGSTVDYAFGTALDPNGVNVPLTFGGESSGKYVLSKDENGSVTISYKLHRPSPIMIFDNGRIAATTEADASVDAVLDVTFSADDLDGLASANWSELRTPSDLIALEKTDTPHKYDIIQNQIEDDKGPYNAFSFKGEVRMATALHIDTLTFPT